MKKVILILCLMIISISNVYALTDEEELQLLIDKVPDSYNLTIENRVDINKNGAFEAYLYYDIKNILEKNNSEFNQDKGYSFSITKNGNIYRLELSNLKKCYVEEENYYSLCEQAIKIEKNIAINFNYIDDTSKDDEIERIKQELDKRAAYSDYENSISVFHESNAIVTTLKQITNIEKKYSVNLIYVSRKGSTMVSNDGTTETGWNAGNMYIRINNIIYSNICVEAVDNTININNHYYNHYYPRLNLEDYEDIDKYIDDALVDFPNKAHLTNYEIINQINDKRYLKRTENDNDYYEVLIKDLDDNVEWTMFFNGKLRDNESPLEGDMNGNGKIDLKDIILLIKKYLGII